MKEKWRKFAARLPKLSRKGRIIRNLTVVLLVLAALPWLLEWPVFTAEQAFRQLERRALLSPSEIVMRWGDAFLCEGEDWVTVGKVDTYDSSWKPFQKKIARIQNVEPKGELIVVALPDTEGDVLWVAVHGIPEGAVTGELSMTISGVDDVGWTVQVADEETFTDRADRDEERPEWMFFSLASHGDHPGLNRRCIMDFLWHELTLGDGVDRYPYTLTFEDEKGGVLDTRSGILPQSMSFLDSRM